VVPLPQKKSATRSPSLLLALMMRSRRASGFLGIQAFRVPRNRPMPHTSEFPRNNPYPFAGYFEYLRPFSSSIRTVFTRIACLGLKANFGILVEN
jgi:hypothetical protein